MNPKTFSKKEAIVRGIDMTKKYFGILLVVMLVYLAFEGGRAALQYFAGSGHYITKVQVHSLYKDSTTANSFYQYLQETGYINDYGKIQEKLEQTTIAEDLDLTPVWEKDRQKIFNFINPYRYRLPFPRPLYYLLLIVLWILGLLMQLGLTKISLQVSRDEEPRVGELFANGSYVLPYFLSSMCYGLALLGGFLLLIVPGIILGIAMQMFTFFLLDQNTGPIQSLSESRRLTKGVRWQLFSFNFVLVLLNVAGALCLVVGLFFTVPASMVAMAYVYDRLRIQDEPGLAT